MTSLYSALLLFVQYNIPQIAAFNVDRCVIQKSLCEAKRSESGDI
jgi:hypothetical protein